MSSYADNTPAKIVLSNAERLYFETVARRAAASQRDAVRSRIILLAAQNLNNTVISQQLSCTRKTVRNGVTGTLNLVGLGLLTSPGPADPVSTMRPPVQWSLPSRVSFLLTEDFHSPDLAQPISTPKQFKNSICVQHDQPSPPGSRGDSAIDGNFMGDSS